MSPMARTFVQGQPLAYAITDMNEAQFAPQGNTLSCSSHVTEPPQRHTTYPTPLSTASNNEYYSSTRESMRERRICVSL